MAGVSINNVDTTRQIGGREIRDSCIVECEHAKRKLALTNPTPNSSRTPFTGFGVQSGLVIHSYLDFLGNPRSAFQKGKR